MGEPEFAPPVGPDKDNIVLRHFLFQTELCKSIKTKLASTHERFQMCGKCGVPVAAVPMACRCSAMVACDGRWRPPAAVTV